MITATLSKDQLEFLYKFIKPVTDEIYITMGKDGWKAISVDRGHVVMIRFHLIPENFKEYSYDKDEEFMVGLQVDKLKDWYDALKAGHVTKAAFQKEDSGGEYSWAAQIDGLLLRKGKTLDIAGNPQTKWPKMSGYDTPMFTLSEAQAGELKTMLVKNPEYSAFLIQYGPDGLKMGLAKDLELMKKISIKPDQLKEHGSKELEATSVNADYLRGIFKAVAGRPSNKDALRFTFKSEAPIQLEFVKDNIREAIYLLAPKLADEDTKGYVMAVLAKEPKVQVEKESHNMPHYVQAGALKKGRGKKATTPYAEYITEIMMPMLEDEVPLSQLIENTERVMVEWKIDENGDAFDERELGVRESLTVQQFRKDFDQLNVKPDEVEMALGQLEAAPEKEEEKPMIEQPTEKGKLTHITGSDYTADIFKESENEYIIKIFDNEGTVINSGVAKSIDEAERLVQRSRSLSDMLKKSKDILKPNEKPSDYIDGIFERTMRANLDVAEMPGGEVVVAKGMLMDAAQISKEIGHGITPEMIKDWVFARYPELKKPEKPKRGRPKKTTAPKATVTSGPGGPEVAGEFMFAGHPINYSVTLNLEDEKAQRMPDIEKPDGLSERTWEERREDLQESALDEAFKQYNATQKKEKKEVSHPPSPPEEELEVSLPPPTVPPSKFTKLNLSELQRDAISKYAEYNWYLLREAIEKNYDELAKQVVGDMSYNPCFRNLVRSDILLERDKNKRMEKVEQAIDKWTDSVFSELKKRIDALPGAKGKCDIHMGPGTVLELQKIMNPEYGIFVTGGTVTTATGLYTLLDPYGLHGVIKPGPGELISMEAKRVGDFCPGILKQVSDDKEQASKAIDSARNMVKEAEARKGEVTGARETLQKAQRSMARLDYDAAVDFAQEAEKEASGAISRAEAPKKAIIEGFKEAALKAEATIKALDNKAPESGQMEAYGNFEVRKTSRPAGAFKVWDTAQNDWSHGIPSDVDGPVLGNAPTYDIDEANIRAKMLAQWHEEKYAKDEQMRVIMEPSGQKVGGYMVYRFKRYEIANVPEQWLQPPAEYGMLSGEKKKAVMVQPPRQATTIFEKQAQRPSPPQAGDELVRRWRKKHTGYPLCECAHDPPCPACKSSIAKFGCTCVEKSAPPAVPKPIPMPFIPPTPKPSIGVIFQSGNYQIKNYGQFHIVDSLTLKTMTIEKDLELAKGKARGFAEDRNRQYETDPKFKNMVTKVGTTDDGMTIYKYGR